MRASRFLPFGPIGGICAVAAFAAACGSSTSTVTSPSTIERCGVTLGAIGATIPAEGGSGRLTVTTARECAWSAASEASWLSLVGPASGQGDGAVEYVAALNTDPVVRRAAIVANSHRAEITQAAGTCTIQLQQPSAGFPPVGGTGRIDVVASSQLCAWTAAAQVDWITIAPPASGTGNAALTFVVAPTSGPPRTGTIAVAGQRFSVTQSEGCAYAIAPVSSGVGAAGGGGTITVSTGDGCPWTTFSNVPWITVAAGSAGAGPGTVAFSVAPTEGPERSGMLVVAGQPFTVTQAAGCSFDVAPLTHMAPPTGATLPVHIAAAPGCAWSALSTAPWINLVGAATGSGSATVTLAVAESTGAARNGTVTIAGRTVTVSQGAGCTFAIASESAHIAAGGGTGAVTVTAPGGCAWSASSNVPWITIIQGAAGSGNGSVQFSVAATTGGGRSGTLTIAGRAFTVTQDAGCSFSLSPQSTEVFAGGGAAAFSVLADGSCAWTAVSNAEWISITSGASGTGGGTVQLSVAPNTAAPRVGTVTVGGSTFTVNQQGGCSFTLSASTIDVAAGGASGSVDVTGEPTCTWTASAAQDWITIASATSGTGSGTVQFAVAPNPGPARTGQILIGGSTVTVNQADGCSFAIAPQEQAVGAAGGDAVVNVSGAAGCGWSAVSGAPWLTIVSGASGSGSGTVHLTIAANSDTARTGLATIAGLTFTVAQESGCAYDLGPPSRSAEAGGGPGSFTVNTTGSCPWTATSDVPWITITDGATGIGPGKVDYMVQPNTGAARVGTITLQGKILTVNQAGI